MRQIRHLWLWVGVFCAGVTAAPAQTVSSSNGWTLSFQEPQNTLEVSDAQRKVVRSYSLPLCTSTVLEGACLHNVVLWNQQNRNSFIATFSGNSELWEISYDRNAEPIYDGLVHDYRNGEAIGKPGFLGVRRTRLDEPLEDFFVDPESPHVLGVARSGVGGVHVINLDIHRTIAVLKLPDQPRLSKTFVFVFNGQRLIAIAHGSDAANLTVSVFDMKSWTPSVDMNAQKAAASTFKNFNQRIQMPVPNR